MNWFLKKLLLLMYFPHAYNLFYTIYTSTLRTKGYFSMPFTRRNNGVTYQRRKSQPAPKSVKNNDDVAAYRRSSRMSVITD